MDRIEYKVINSYLPAIINNTANNHMGVLINGNQSKGSVKIIILKEGFSVYSSWFKKIALVGVFLLLFNIASPVLATINSTYHTVTPEEAYGLLHAGITAFDVRSVEEYAAGHLSGAICIPYDNFSPQNPSIAKLNLDEPVLLYCGTGTRSQLAAELLIGWGYSQVHNLEGGLQSWVAVYGDEYLSQRQCIHFEDFSIVLVEGLQVEITQKTGAEKNKLVAEALKDGNVKELRAFLIREGFTPNINEAGATELLWENKAGNGKITATLLPFQDQLKQDRVAVISVEDHINSEGESDKIITAVILEPLDGELVKLNKYLIQEGEISLVEDFTLEVGTPNSFCTWAMAALCGTGGAAACYGLAALLGITTGLGGLALAVVCGLIVALGCTGATLYVCG